MWWNSKEIYGVISECKNKCGQSTEPLMITRRRWVGCSASEHNHLYKYPGPQKTKGGRIIVDSVHNQRRDLAKACWTANCSEKACVLRLLTAHWPILAFLQAPWPNAGCCSAFPSLPCARLVWWLSPYGLSRRDVSQFQPGASRASCSPSTFSFSLCKAGMAWRDWLQKLQVGDRVTRSWGHWLAA